MFSLIGLFDELILKIMDSENKESSVVLEEKKKKKWTDKIVVKYKNNFSKYITIEPLLGIFLIRYLIFILEQPHILVKKCVELNGDEFLCEDVGALSYYKAEGGKIWTEMETNFSKTFNGRAWNDPEDVRVYEMFNKVTSSLNYHEDYTVTKLFVKIFAKIVHILIMMLMSSYSDTFGKRKICLWIPLLGQFLVSIVNIIGAFLLNILPYDYIKLTIIGIESLTGGKELLLFGCFCYMSRAEMKKNIYIGLGLFGLVVTVSRNTPLDKLLHQSNTTGIAYTNAILLYFVYIIVCCLYVKIILNELKRPKVEPATKETDDENGATTEGGDKESKTKTKTLSKGNIVAKAFFLDVFSDYLKLVIKDRKYHRRWILILYLLINFVTSLWPYNKDYFIATFAGRFRIDAYDLDGVILITIPILVIFFKVSDITIAIIATMGPLIQDILFKSFEFTNLYVLDIIHNDDGVYDRFMGLVRCVVLLLIVENTEMRIYLVFKCISYGGTFIGSKLYKENMKKSLAFTQNFILLAYMLFMIISLGFWLFVRLMKKSEILKAKDLQSKIKSKWKAVAVAQIFMDLAASSTVEDAMNRPQTSSFNGESEETLHL